MDNENSDAHDLIEKAREALRRGDKETAHSLGEQAALLAPGMEDAWLILAATDPNPEESLAYAQQALEIDPSSERAFKAVQWSIARLKSAQASPAAVPAETPATAPVPVAPEELPAEKKSNNRPLLYAAGVLALCLCLAVVIAGSLPMVAASIGNAALGIRCAPCLRMHPTFMRMRLDSGTRQGAQ